MHRLLVERLGWGYEPTPRDVARFADRSPRACPAGTCGWCAGNRTASSRRRAARAEPWLD
jgi:hypothetical protein